MLAKKTAKNQITLPKEIVKEFEGVVYFDASAQEGRIILTPVTIRPMEATLTSIRDKMHRLGISEKDVKSAVDWARKRTKR
jgi:hypothetical protein